MQPETSATVRGVQHQLQFLYEIPNPMVFLTKFPDSKPTSQSSMSRCPIFVCALIKTIFGEISFIKDSMLLLATKITKEGISFISGLVGSGNLTGCSQLRFPTGLK